MSSRSRERTITSEKEGVDLLVLSAQNGWGCAQVCFQGDPCSGYPKKLVRG